MKLIFSLTLVLICDLLIAQQGPAYQAIIRKSNGQINANSDVFLQFSILDGNAFGPVLYKEKQALTSDAFGWISTNVGSGTVLNGNLATVNWGSGDKILLIECSTERNGTYSTLGNSIINPSYLRGIQGIAGAKGDKGDQGIQGIAGAKGDKGDQGIQGIAGAKGDKGDQGIQGIAGAKGDKGDQGIQGIAGAKGDKGDQGIQGIAGAKGDKGDQGIQGVKGDKGDQGIQGIAGAKGDKGDQGIQGVKGDKGDTGSQGPAGSYTAGNGVTINSNTISVSNLIGDVTGAPNNNTVVKLQGKNVSSSAPVNGQVLQWNGTAWTPQALSSMNDWSLNGNTGITDNNFLGTLDSKPIRFKVNNLHAGILDVINVNTYMGIYSGLSNTNGTHNAGLGYHSLEQNTSGSYNTALGNGSLRFNISGDNNTAIGAESLNAYKGDGLTAVGYKALTANTSGGSNVAVGWSALYQNTSGSNNTAVGMIALGANNGSDNSAFGNGALSNNTSGNNNTAVGSKSLQSNTTATNNTAVGAQTLLLNTGNGNTAVGSLALTKNTGGYSTAIGFGSLAANTTGENNVAVGYASMGVNDKGYSNTAVGNIALFSNTTGFENTSIGRESLNKNTTGDGNNALGFQSLHENQTGFQNVGIGYQALYNNNNNRNVAIGTQGLYNTTSGQNNVAVGAYAGYNNNNSNSTFVGEGSGSSAVVTNGTALGYGAIVNASNKVRIGNTSVLSIEGQVPFSPSSDRRLKEKVQSIELGLDFINSLNPVVYHRISNPNDDLEMGLIAQDLQQLLSKYTVHYGTVQESSEGYYTLRYNDLLAPMIKAIQELKVQLEEQKNICKLQQEMLDRVLKAIPQKNELNASVPPMH
jgi:hypothetical protein